MPWESRSICHGTMLEWCSISLMITAWPGCNTPRPKLCATRLIDSVALRVNTISSRDGALSNPAT
jgi:hypothetical protein